MKKVVLASLLAVASAVPTTTMSYAQLTGGSSSVQMSQEEYKLYNDANTAATPAAKAAGFEAYLKAYPNSSVKLDVLNQLLFAYSQTGDKDKTLDAGDRLLALDPSNLRALTFEVYFRRVDADALTDPAAKVAALDVVAGYAQKGLDAKMPKDMKPEEFKALKAKTDPTFQSAVADDLIAKKDNAGAIKVLTAEITGDEADTKVPSAVLQDVYSLANAYYTSTPPDYLNCAWFATRAAAFAPEPYKTSIGQLASYCYKKFHGDATGYDAMQAAVQTSLLYPATLVVKPAPKPEDIVAGLIADTPDLATLAVSDREFVLQYGKTADADKAFDSVKGKSVQFPDVLVISATADDVMVAITDDAIQGKMADFDFKFATPLTKIPVAGDKITLTGTYASYTAKPTVITMSDAAVVEPKPVAKPKPKAPVHHTTKK